MLKASQKVAVVDLETTGPKVEEGDRIIQIGAVIYAEGEFIAEYSMLINPEREIPFHIQQLTGINKEQVSKAPTFQSVASLWYERLKDCVLVAHNLGFDLKFLQQSFAMMNFEYSPLAIDSVKLAKIILPKAKGFNLTDLSKHFKIEFEDAHDALSDAQATSQIVSQLAHKVNALAPEIIADMQPFIEKLHHDEILFFNEPSLFILNRSHQELMADASLEFSGSNIKGNLESAKAEYIIEKWGKEPHLIVEDTIRPMSHQMILKLVKAYSSQEAVLLSLPSISDLNFIESLLKRDYQITDYMLLKSQKHYLHQEAFNDLIEYYPDERDNQQELLSIAATIHWQSFSELKDYSEVHRELNIQPLLEKYSPQQLNLANHTNYHQAIKLAKQTKLVLTYDSFLQNLFKYQSAYTKSLVDRHLIIFNLSLFTRSARITYQSEIEISTLFTTVRAIISQIKYIYDSAEPYSGLLPILESTSSKLNQVIIDISEFLNETIYDYSVQQEMTQQYVDSHSIFYTKLLENMAEITSQLRTIAVNLKEFSLKQPIEENRKIIQTILTKITEFHQAKSEVKYILIAGKRVTNQFYDLKLISRPLVFARSQIGWLNNFAKALLLSPGDYNYNEYIGLEHWLQLNEFAYFSMPAMTVNDVQDILIPVEYIQGRTDAEFNEDLSYFLMDQASELDQNIIIMTQNQKQIQTIYRKLTSNSTIQNQYTISAQGISGSSNRIRRRTEETEWNIIIISERYFYKEQWVQINKPVSLVLVRLPFYSSKQTDIMAMTQFISHQANDEMISFERVQLPMMIQRFKYLLTYISQYYPNNRFYLLDNRLYTKYYGVEVIESLEKLADFILFE